MDFIWLVKINAKRELILMPSAKNIKKIEINVKLAMMGILPLTKLGALLKLKIVKFTNKLILLI